MNKYHTLILILTVHLSPEQDLFVICGTLFIVSFIILKP